MHKETLDLNKYFKEPLQNNISTLNNHLGRYYYALNKLNINNKDIVIDYGCGQGYGTYLISQKANYVYGLDINKKFLEFAKENMQTKNNSFLNAEKLNEIMANKAICIETIEHLKENDMIELLHKLSISDELFLTFPVGNNKPSSYNTFHKCEPSIQFVYDILKEHYGKIEIEIEEIKNNYGYNQNFCMMRGLK